MKNSIFSIKTIVAIGIGSAIFVILGRFGSIPTGVPNTNLETTYAFLALMSMLFGPIAGFLIGFIGHTLKDVLMWGSPWFSWIIASGVVGLIIGFTTNRIKLSEGHFGLKEIVQFNVFQIGANGLAWFVIAPVLDIVIYDEPTNKVFAQGVVAGALNMATVAVLGTILAIAYAKTRPKSKSLTKEL